MDMIRIGKFIAQRRTRIGLTQSELGDILGVTGKAVSKWERGLSCPDVTIIRELAETLKISIDEFLSGESVDKAKTSNIEPKCGSPADETARYGAAEDIRLMPTGEVVSPYLFGSNLEHTRSVIFGGISAQMLKNRKFAGKPAAAQGCAWEWFPIGGNTVFNEDAPYARHCESYHMSRRNETYALNIVHRAPDTEAGFGQQGLTVFAGKEYEFRLVAKTPRDIAVTVALTDRDGGKVYDTASITADTREWQTFTCTLCPDTTDPEAALRITFREMSDLTVGAVSLMPGDNLRGMRRDVIDRMREIGVTILRWPGGNFAGEYCWEDGLLPCDERSPFESYLGIETQPYTMGYDYHEINIDDFIALCREISAEPFITINATWNTPQENAAFVEYCNGDADTEYGRRRIERGYTEPYHVQFWSLGNEMGYGHMEGDNTPYGYCKNARSNAEAMLAVDPGLLLCSSGPYPDPEWAKHSATPLSDIVALTSLHRYSPLPEYRNSEDPRAAYYEKIADVRSTTRGLIYDLRASLPEKSRISFDEWNVWYAWYRDVGVFEGLHAALMMHQFIELAEEKGIGVACHFEAVNEGMIRVLPDRAELTAAGQIMSALKHHSGGQICHISEFAAVTLKDDCYTATLINASFDEEKTFTLDAVGGIAASVLYTCREIVPGNTFTVSERMPEKDGERYRVTLPAHSVLFLQMSR